MWRECLRSLQVTQSNAHNIMTKNDMILFAGDNVYVFTHI